LETDVRSDGFEMVSDRIQGERHDRIRFSLDGNNVEFRFDLHENASATEAEAGLRIRLDRIIEFRDQNGDGAFQQTDDVRAEYEPGDLSLTGILAANVTSNGVPGVQVTANYTFRDVPNATLGFRATAFGTPTTFENLDLKPVEMKVDLLFGSFPYTESGTLPAVELRVESEGPGTPETLADGIVFRAGNLNATFRWKQVAVVDGVERPVRVTVIQNEIGLNETEADVAFAYVRGSAIEHDPTVGFSPSVLVRIVPTGLGNAAFYAVGVLTAVAVFGTFAFARKGRKAKGK